MRIGAVLGISVMAALFPVTLLADTIAWTNTVGGSWDVAVNWNPQRVPSPYDVVEIVDVVGGVEHGAYQVTKSGTVALYSRTVTNYASLQVGNGALLVSDGGTLDSATIPGEYIKATAVIHSNSAWRCNGPLIVGNNGSQNSLRVEKGGQVWPASLILGFAAGAQLNLVQKREPLTVSGEVILGQGGSANTLDVPDLHCNRLVIGASSTASDNGFGGAGTYIVDTQVQVGPAGVNNAFEISENGSLNCGSLVIGGPGASGSYLDVSYGGQLYVSGSASVVGTSNRFLAGGSVSINGSLSMDGFMLSYADGGTRVFCGSYAQTARGILYVHYLGGGMPEDGIGIDASGTASLAGSLVLSLYNAPIIGKTFHVLSCTSLQGVFDQITPDHPLPHDMRLIPEYSASGLVVRVAGGIDVLDPNPSLLDSSGGITTDVDALTNTPTLAINGVVADGVTELLLRMLVSSTNSVTFSLADPADGALCPVWDSTPSETNVSVKPVQDSQSNLWAFALYTSPTDFSAVASSDTNRTIGLQASSEISGTITQQLTLERPPVVLVHGVWSDGGIWTRTGFKQWLDTHGFRTYAANYGYGNADSFLPHPDNSIGENAPANAVFEAVGRACRTLRSMGIGVTQVDVVGHSMGGLATRAFEKYPVYKTINNFQSGYVHKLITIGTPHLGSEYANFLWAHRNDAVIGLALLRDVMSFPAMFIDSGAVQDLQTNSVALYYLGASQIPGHAIISDAMNGTCGEILLNWILQTIKIGTTVDSIFGGDNDTIVSTHSQAGGLSLVDGQAEQIDVPYGILHAKVPGCTDATETDSTNIEERVLALLQANVTDPVFAAGWPAPPVGNSQSIASRASVGNLTGVRFKGVGSTSTSTQGIQGITITSPSPGTIVHPGEAIALAASPTNGVTVSNVVFLVQASGTLPGIVPASGPPYEAIFVVPQDFIGQKNIVVLANDTSGALYGDMTYVIVQVPAQLVSIEVTPSDCDFVQLGQRVGLYVLGDYGDGIQREIHSSDAGTTYRTLSGADSVAGVDSNGVVTAMGNGQDSIIISNGGISTSVVVNVQIQNVPSVLTEQAKVLFYDNFEQFSDGAILSETNYIPFVGQWAEISTNYNDAGENPSAVVASNLLGSTRAYFDMATVPYEHHYDGRPTAASTNSVATLSWKMWIEAVKAPSNTFGGWSVELTDTNMSHSALLFFNDAGQVWAFTNQPSLNTLAPIGSWSNLAGTVMTNRLVMNYPAGTFEFSINGNVLTNLPIPSFLTNVMDGFNMNVWEAYSGGGGYTVSTGNRFALDDVQISTFSNGAAQTVDDYIVALKMLPYTQTDAGSPGLATSDFLFHAGVTPVWSNSVLSAVDQAPGGLNYTLAQFGSGSFKFDQSFPDKASLDIAFTNGTYTMAIITTAGTYISTMALPGDAYPAAPQLLNWDAAQTINAASNFTFTWSFAAGTTNDLVQFTISDASGNTVLDTGGLRDSNHLNGTATSCTANAGILAASTLYTGDLTFVKFVAFDTNSVPGALGVAGYAAQTTFTLNTLCGYAISPTNMTISGAPYLGSASVITSSTCPWTVTSDAGFLTLAISNGVGSSAFGYSVTANSTFGPRTGLLSIAGVPLMRVVQTFDNVGDGLPDWWRALYFGGDGSTTTSQSCGTCDPDHDGMNNLQEFIAGTNPTNSDSVLRITGLQNTAEGLRINWMGGTDAWQCLEKRQDILSTDALWSAIYTNTPPTPVMTNLLWPSPLTNESLFYRIRAYRP